MRKLKLHENPCSECHGVGFEWDYCSDEQRSIKIACCQCDGSGTEPDEPDENDDELDENDDDDE